VITGGPPLTPQQALDTAVARFTRAIDVGRAITSGADVTEARAIVNIALVGRARANLRRGNKAAARTDADAVPSGFTYNMTFVDNPASRARLSNRFWQSTNDRRLRGRRTSSPGTVRSARRRASLGSDPICVLTSGVITLNVPGMTTNLRDEIKQTKPFRSLEQEAMLSVERTAAVLGHRLAEGLRPHGITPTQYNVLRILRGAEPAGLCRNDIRDRLIAQVPDVTRLLDRMEESGLITRERDTVDRRLVNARITQAGLDLLDTLADKVEEIHQDQLGHLTETELRALIDLLAVARQA
jgi:DNA-binding MarR family transcriptional regulator